jgi:hypothetical protein
MNRVTNGFSKMTTATFSQSVKSVVTRMTGNTNFPNQQTAVQALATEADRFYELAEKALDRSKLAILARDACRSKVTDMLHNLGFQVSSVAQGDVEVLASSGFPYTQPRKLSPPMVKPAPPVLSLGTNNGQLDCKVISQPGLKSVNYYITADESALKATDNAGWDIISYNKIKYTFSGLAAGQRYYVRVGLIGVRGQEVISDAVSYIPQ